MHRRRLTVRNIAKAVWRFGNVRERVVLPPPPPKRKGRK